MKTNRNITVSGGRKTFKGPELIEVVKNATHDEAAKRRNQLERETGRIMYMSRKMDEVQS